MENHFPTQAGLTPPLISLIIASSDTADQRDRFLEALTGQGSLEEMEILIVDGNGDAPLVCDGPVRWLPVSRQPLPLLWGRGLAEARGEWLVILETTCPPAPGWLAALRQRTKGAPSIFGGSVEMEAGHGMIDWSAYFCEYSQFMRPIAEMDNAAELPGNNICFHRSFLHMGKGFLAPGFWKTYWCGELVRNGVNLQATPEMIVHFDKHYRLVPFLHRRFHHGRCYAGMRNRQLPGWKRLAYMAGTLVLPLLMLARMLKKLLPKRRTLGRYFAALPCSMLAVLAWAAGETIGYGFGPGDSCERIY